MRREGLSLRAEVRGWYCPSPSPKILKGHPTHTPHISNNSSPAFKGKHPWPGNQGVLLLSPRCLSHELESVGTIAILQRIHHTIGQHSHLPGHRLDTLLKLGNVSCGKHIPQRYTTSSMSSIHVPKEV